MKALLLLALNAAPAVDEPPKVPAPLACLAQYYAVKAEKRDAGWFAVLPGGRALAYDDGKVKTEDEREAAPDIEDLFAVRYGAGPITPVNDESQDPGRMRIEEVLRATYGRTAHEVYRALVEVPFFGQTVKVHERVVAPLKRVTERLEKALKEKPALKEFLTGIGGTFNWRRIAGTRALSMHSYGVAIDLNVQRSNYWRWERPPRKWKNRFPQEIVDAFEAEGFLWGGRWFHFDTMHFEYRPELVKAECYPPLPAAEAKAEGT